MSAGDRSAGFLIVSIGALLSGVFFAGYAVLLGERSLFGYVPESVGLACMFACMRWPARKSMPLMAGVGISAALAIAVFVASGVDEPVGLLVALLELVSLPYLWWLANRQQ